MVELTKLTKSDFIKILEKYNLGKYKTNKHAWWALDNTVHFITTSKGKFIFKMLESGDKKFAKFQIKISSYLFSKQVSVPKIIQTKKRKNYINYKEKICFVQEFVKGYNKWNYSKPLVKDVANKQSLMNKHLLKLKLTNQFTWGEHEFKKLPQKIPKYKKFNISKEDKKILKEMKVLNKKRLRKTLIHGDFNASNILLRNKKLTAIIDFDDIHEDYLTFELAVFIAHLFVKDSKIECDKIKIYLNEYQKILPLNAEEKKSIYYFALRRLLGVIANNTKQIKIHKNKERELEEWGDNYVKRYIAFKKLGLKKFLDFFKAN